MLLVLVQYASSTALDSSALFTDSEHTVQAVAATAYLTDHKSTELKTGAGKALSTRMLPNTSGNRFKQEVTLVSSTGEVALWH